MDIFHRHVLLLEDICHCSGTVRISFFPKICNWHALRSPFESDYMYYIYIDR